ncbi:hypothetical protein LX16_2680 [Stackebrandtia albiflava]|uniref:Secreted protein n=1 Tax=Stackebrandtia albiflava TaxID=406432 RepID=A0A562V238_9ACTN|nr:hypothetical protein [Stackebrandtia albiflava]TWJ11938.1 hypothetical protein LX16_2680 [Stackebrandtia albiflava]
MLDRTRTARRVAVAALAGMLLTGGGFAPPARPDVPAPARPDRAETTAPVLAFDFSGAPAGQSGSTWRTGCFGNIGSAGGSGCITVDGDGALRPAGDRALRFPHTDGGKAVILFPHTASVNPGTADFQLTARIAVTGEGVTPNSNVIQKGLFDTPGGQWKLQTDRGVPSCRIAGIRDGAPVNALAFATESIADDGPVPVRCARRDGRLLLTVGDRVYVSPDDATMDITNTCPVTLGGKGVGAGNDQWHGELSGVAFAVG